MFKWCCCLILAAVVGCEIQPSPPITMTLKIEDRNGEFKEVFIDFPDTVRLDSKEEIEGAITELESLIRSLRATSERLPVKPDPTIRSSNR